MGSAEVQGELWSRAADDWASLQEVQHAPLFEAMLDATGVAEGTRLLDAGCGGGYASVLASRRGAVVAGLDAAPGLIDIAQHRVPEGDFRVGDLESLPFDSHSFDAVVAANSVQYAGNRVAAIRELSRVATPAATIAIGLFDEPDRVDLSAILSAMGRALPEPPKGDGPFGLSGVGKLEGLVQEANLELVGGGEVNLAFVYRDLDEFWTGMISGGPPQAIMDQVGEEKLKEAVLTAIAPFVTDTGEVRMENNSFRYLVARPSD